MEVMLKNVRIAFMDSLFQAKDFRENKNFRHSATFIYEPGSQAHKDLEAAIQAEANNVFGKKAPQMLESFRNNPVKYPITKDKKNSDGEPYPDFVGKFSIAAHRRQEDGAPLVLDNVKDPSTGKAARLRGSEGRLHPGAYVNAKISIYCQEGQKGGVRATLLGVQFHAPGEGFGGPKVASEDDFSVKENDEDSLV
jgi:hypothetical protein